MFQKLNFPEFDFRIKRYGDRSMVFDILRKKDVALTPEEWVRQHMVHYLILVKGYPRSLIKIESGLKYNKLSKRSDILIYDSIGNPYMVIECKSPETRLDNKTLHQVGTYSKALKVKYMGITNGLSHFFWSVDHEQMTSHNLSDFPDYE